MRRYKHTRSTSNQYAGCYDRLPRETGF